MRHETKDMDASPIKKLILPVAGTGTRLKPLTLTVPKNLLPVAGKTIIERVLDEIVGTSINDVALVISPDHRARFAEFLETIRRRYPGFRFHLREQAKPFGHGHALYQAADLYRDEPVLVRFCDDILVHDVPTLPAMMALYEKYGRPLLLLKKVPHEEVSRYGIVETDLLPYPFLHRVRSIVEKPLPEEAPTDLASVGGYVLTPGMLRRVPAMIKTMEEKNDALLVPHIFAEELADGGEVYGWEHPGLWLDCGTLEGYQKANKFMASGNIVRGKQQETGWI